MNYNTLIIKASGKNIDSFFQNLITNDINKLKHIPLLYSAILSPQGKFFYDFFIQKNKNSFLIEVNEKAKDELLNYFKKFDIRKELTFNYVDGLVCKVLLYNNLDKNIRLELSKNLKIHNANYTIYLDPRIKNFLVRCWINKSYLKNNNKLFISDINEIEIERIRKCLPNSEVDLEKNKSFILNFGLENYNCVSFDKGCYIGQENTARQKYRGKQKYSLKFIELVKGKFPQLNEEIYYKEKKIGVMKSYKRNYGLALLRNDLQLNKECTHEVFANAKFVIRV